MVIDSQDFPVFENGHDADDEKLGQSKTRSAECGTLAYGIEPSVRVRSTKGRVWDG